MCVCVCVWAITFELHDRLRRYLERSLSLTVSRSSLKVKVIGQTSVRRMKNVSGQCDLE